MRKMTLAAVLTVLCIEAAAGVRLPSVIGDGMIIQRDEPICFWGWADPGESFTLTWKGGSHRLAAGEDGRWEITLPPSGAGGPYTLQAGEVTVEGILVGDVFLCSGQSNMELPLSRVTDMFAEEIAGYDNPEIRQYLVPKDFDFNTPKEDTFPSAWKECSGNDVMDFSAIAYFFAREIYGKTGVPVGIVNSSWGGTPVEAWMSEDALRDYPLHLNTKRVYSDESYCRHIKELESEAFATWNRILHDEDPGYSGVKKWFDPDLDDSGWEETDMFSTSWGNDGMNPCGGSHWLRRDFRISGRLAGKEAVLRLGCIVDADSVYVNGHFVGTTSYQYPPRIYRIPEGILHKGVNNVTVRIVSNGGQPSFVREKTYGIFCGGEFVNLEGIWKYRQGAPMPQAPSMMFFCYKPVCLYNAMISPLRKLKFRGVLWYQGESNVGRRNEYAGLLLEMMKDWRSTFGMPGLPFYIVELADFLHLDDIGGRRAWQEMRVEQARAAESDPHATLINNADTGEWNDIHPLDKKTPGKRAAEAVLEDMKRKN